MAGSRESGGRADRAALQYAYHHATALRIDSVALLLVSVATAAAALLQPTLMGGVLDGIVGHDLTLAYRDVALMLGVTLLLGILSGLKNYQAGVLASRVTWRVREDMMVHLLHMESSAYDKTLLGELLARLEGDTSAFSQLILARLAVVPELLRVCIVLWVVLRMSVTLTALQVALLPILWVAAGSFGKWLRRAQRRGRELSDEFTEYCQETLSGNRDVKVLQLEEEREIAFRGLRDSMLDSARGIFRLSALAGLTQTFIGGGGSLGVIAFAAWQVVNGRLTIGQMVAFTSYAAQLASSIGVLVGFHQLRQHMLASIERVHTLLTETPVEETGSAVRHERDVAKGVVAFSGVCFGYGTDRWVLEDVTLEARPGRVTGLAGASGEGKTTLFCLLLGLYRAERGRILLDGVDIRALGLRRLRQNVAVVSQNPYFFHGSIRENLLCANRGASMRDMEEACELAGASDFIAGLRQGYETPMGDRGAQLSVGQLQRLALARCLLRQSRVVLFDEVTSAVDGSAEGRIHDAIRVASRDRTVIIVAHRPTTMGLADIVYFLHGGHIVASGGHRDLLQGDSRYRQLYDPMYRTQ